MIWTRPKPVFNWQWSNYSSVRPAQNSLGSTLPGNNVTINTKDSWGQVASSGNVSQDVFGLWIAAAGIASTGEDRACLMDVGVDPAGGSSYGVLIPNLIISCAPALWTSGMQQYYFPIWIRAGSTIAVRQQVNGATRASEVLLKLFGDPLLGEGWDPKVGTFVQDYGTATASSEGTAVTSGTTSEGAWTALASSIARPIWHMQGGFSIRNSTMTALAWHLDIGAGDASNKQVVIENQLFATNSTEEIFSPGHFEACEFEVPAGSNIYARIQCSGAATSGLTAAAWGVGG